MGNTGPARRQLEAEHFDLIVIGGGINGVAIARECARAGKRTLLVEQHDFASGTTSRATRIIHGGLRYLEHGDIWLVRESLRERERLLKTRPHLVHSRKFILAMPQGYGRRSALAIRFGLWLYSRIAGTVNASQQQFQVSQLEGALDKNLNLNLFSYEDAQCEFPERLTAEWLVEAVQAGAVARNYTQVLEIVVREDKARGVIVRDLLSDQETEIRSDWVINATGPWADFVLRQSGIQEDRLVAGVRGSHLVIPIFPGAPQDPLYTEAIDGRPIFLVPWAGQLLFGTTEVAQEGDPSRVAPSRTELQYLFQSLHRLFPACGIGWSDVRYAYAGVRPLPYSVLRNKLALGSLTRRHKLHDHLEHGIAGLITLIGGKLTTAAKVGRECARAIGARVPEQPDSLTMAPSGIDKSFSDWVRQTAQKAQVSPDSAAAIAEWHGSRAVSIAQLAASDPLLRQTLCPHTVHIVAEAVDAVRFEFAVSLADILLRRVPVALGACWREGCTRAAANRIGAALAWPEARISMEIEDCETERSHFLCQTMPTDVSSGQLESVLLESRAQ